MWYWVLTAYGTVIARSTVGHIPDDELGTDTIKEHIAKFNTDIAVKLKEINEEGTLVTLDGVAPAEPEFLLWDSEVEYDPAELAADMPEADNFTPDTLNIYCCTGQPT
jgi:hypothetical protein